MEVLVRVVLCGAQCSLLLGKGECSIGEREAVVAW